MPIERPKAPAIQFSDRWKLVMTGLAAIGVFVAVVQYSLTLKGLIGFSILILWGGFELFIRFNKRFVNSIWTGIQHLLGNPTTDVLTQSDRIKLAVSARWLFGGILVAILSAAGFKSLEVRFTPPQPSASSFIYSMIVLDASEKMNQPFEGSTSKWDAVEHAFFDYYNRANDDSKYGLIVIGGQNHKENSFETCGVPSVPLIPLTIKDSYGKTTVSNDLSLNNLQTQIRLQQPEGDGSLSRAFFLAKNQLEDLPIDPNIIRIIVLIASTNDACEGDIDWDELIQDIQLVRKEISIHKELILLEDEISPRLEEILAQNNSASQSLKEADLHIQVATNYFELSKKLSELMERLDAYYGNPPLVQTVASGNTKAPVLPTSRATRVATRDRQGSDPTSTVGVLTITKTFTCTPSLTSTGTYVPPASTGGDFILASTMSFTPTPTVTLTALATPTRTLRVYPTEKPTKEIIDTVAPPPTDVPPPPPTDDPCCMHCSAISQPCGDACIPLTSVCHVGPGCACQP